MFAPVVETASWDLMSVWECSICFSFLSVIVVDRGTSLLPNEH